MDSKTLNRDQKIKQNKITVTYESIINGTGFVNIERLFDYVKNLTRGGTFKCANDLAKDTKGKWIKTFEHNTTKNYIRFSNFMKIYCVSFKPPKVCKLMRDRKFETQGLDAVTEPVTTAIKSMFTTVKSTIDLPTELKTTLENVTKTAMNANNFFEKANEIQDSMIKAIQMLTSVSKSFFDPTNIIMWIFKILAFINLLREPNNREYGNLISLVALILPTGIGEHVSARVCDLTLAIKGVIERFVVKFTTQTNDNHDCTIITVFFKLVRDMFVNCTSGVDRTTFNDMKMNSERIGFMIRGLSQVKTVYEYFLKLIKMILEYFGLEIHNRDTDNGQFTPEKYESFVDDYHKYKTEDGDKKAETKKSYALATIDLHKRGEEILGSLMRLSLTEKGKDLCRAIPSLRHIVNDLKETVVKIPSYFLTEKDETRRNKPYWCYIFGKPRIGKSAFFQYLLLNELVLRGNLVQDYTNIANYTYFRRCGSEYWDGYNGQLVTWYNDIFQLNSTTAEVVKTIGELTDIIDDNPCLVNMAACEKKEKVYFASKIIISNGQNDLPQQQFLTNNCWSSGIHILQRRNCVVELILNKNYQKPDGTINHQAVVKAMKDPNIEKITCKDVQLVPVDMYVIKFREPTTGYVIRVSSLPDAVNDIVDDMLKYINGQEDFKKKLFQFFENRFQDKTAQGEIRPLKNETFVVAPVNSNQGDCQIHCIRTTRVPKTQVNDKSTETEDYQSTIDDEELVGMYTSMYPPSNLTDTHLSITRDDHGLPNLPKRTCTCYERCMDFIDRIQAFHGGFIPSLNSFVKIFDRHHQCMDMVEMEEAIIEILAREGKSGILAQMYLNETTPFLDKAKKKCLEACEKLRRYFRELVGPFWTVIKHISITLMIGFLTSLVTVLLTVAAAKFAEWLIIGKPKKKKATVQTAEMTRNYKPARIYRKQNRRSNSVPRNTTTQGYDESNVAIENVMRDHFVRLVLHFECGGRLIVAPQVANAVAISGNMFLTPQHYYRRFVQLLESDNYNDAFYRLYLSNGTTIDLSIEQVNWYIPNEYDTAYFCIKELSAFRDITHYFVRDGDPLGLQRGYLYGIRSSVVNGLDDLKVSLLAVSNIQKETIAYDSGEAKSVVDGSVLNNMEFEGIDHYVYNTNLTVQGDCGMLLMTAGQSVGCRKILGIHVAASSTTQEGISCPIFQEDLQQAIDWFCEKKLTRNIRTQLNEFIDYNIPQLTTLETEIVKEGRLNVVGKLKPIVYQGKKFNSYIPVASKTTISKSMSFDLMEEDFGQNINKPAHLVPFIDEHGERKSPLCMAMKKYQVHVRFLEEEDREEIIQHIVDSFNSQSIYPLSRRRLLTDEECANGYGAMKRIDITTSAGYPYTMIERNGKRNWVKVTERDQLPSLYEVEDFVLSNVNERIELAKKGIIRSTIFCDTLKDETRPIEKVNKGKTRIFQIGPFDLTLAMRKYFGAFVDMSHTSYLKGEIAIGIDPNSHEWGLKFRRLTRFGMAGWAGDFGNYDASIWVQFAHWCADIINRWYGGSDEDYQVRLTLLLTLFHSYHAILDMVFILYNGNPSGNLLTTILNCLVFMIMIRKMFLERYRSKYDLKMIDDLWARWIYGDDNIVIFRDGYYIPFSWAQSFFNYYGMEYTDALKTGNVDDTPTSVFDMTFLKRRWIIEKGEIWAPMPLENLLEIPRWSESDPMNSIDQMARYNASLLEISNHGYSIFNNVRRKYYNQIQQLIERGHNFKLTDLFTFFRCYDIKRPSIVKAHCQSLEDLDELLYVVGDDSHALKISETLKSIKCHDTIGLDSNDVNFYYIARKFITQVNETHGDTDTPVAVTTEKSTRFEDAPEGTVSIKKTARIPYLYKNSFQQDMHAVVGRPFLLGTFQWRPNDSMGNLKFQVVFPSALASIPELRSICTYHAYMRPEIEVLIQVNGTPMHYGRLMASIGYIDRAFAPNNLVGEFAITGASNVNWVQISANSVRTATLAVPWMSPVERFPTTLMFASQHDDSLTYAELQIRVSIPLLINGTSLASVGCSVYIIVREPNFSGWGIPNLLQPMLQREAKTQMIEEVCEAVQSLKTGVLLSNITSDIASWISKFKPIPVIGAGAGVVSMAVGAASKVIKALGFAIPANVAISQPFWYRNARLMQCEDVANSIPLAPFPNPYVVKDPTFVGTTFEEFDITTYLSHPTYYTHFKISGTDLAESIIYAFPVEPDIYITELDETNYGVPTRLSFLSRLFYWWRGGIRFHFSFTASRFHTMRLRFTWFPYPPTDASDFTKPIKNLTQNQLSTLPSIIFDINGDSECSFTVPFLQPVEWKRMRDEPLGAPVVDYNNYCNGYIYISVVNPLVNSASESATSGIFGQIFVSAAEDFQFAQPTLESIHGNGIYAPQVITSPAAKEEREFKVQMNDENFSSVGLKTKKCPIIGNVEPGHRSENVHMSTDVKSLKQLYNMGGPIGKNRLTAVTDLVTDFVVNAGNNMLPTNNMEQNYASQQNYLFQLAPAFGFYRGSIRVGYEPRSAIGSLGSMSGGVTYDNDLRDMYLLFTETYPENNAEWFSTEGTHSFFQTLPHNGIFDIPWYSPFRFWPNGSTGLPIDTPKVHFKVAIPQATTAEVHAFLSGGDDFMMFWDAPMPVFWYSTQPLPT